jgi:hypothetical protein
VAKPIPKRCEKPSNLNVAFYIIITAASLTVLAGYIFIASKSFFFMDDFIALYRLIFEKLALPKMNEVYEFRPLSRDLFFLAFYRLFGMGSFGYFLINIIAHGLSAILLFLLLIKLKLSHRLSALVAFLFFSNLAAFEKVTWISNFQHTSYHLFLFLSALFLILSVDAYGLRKILLVSSSVISWICILLSNAAGIFSPVILMLLLAIKLQQNNDGGRRQTLHLMVKTTSAHWFIFLIYLVLILVPYWKQPTVADPYYVDVSLKTFLNNLHFYLKPGHVFLPHTMGFYLIVFSILYWLFLVPRTIKKSFLEKGLFLNFLILVSISGFAYAPFAFLKYQRYATYVSVAFIPWYIIILFPLFSKAIRSQTASSYHRLILPVLVCLLTLSFLPNKQQLIKYFKDSPKLHIYSAWNQTKSILPEIPKGISKVVFIDEESFKRPQEVAMWKIPPFWWDVGHGSMFSILYKRQDIEFEVSTHKIMITGPNAIYINVKKDPAYYTLSLSP